MKWKEEYDYRERESIDSSKLLELSGGWLQMVGADIQSLASAVELDIYLGSCPYVRFGAASAISVFPPVRDRLRRPT